jgi:hypothetical protein
VNNEFNTLKIKCWKQLAFKCFIKKKFLNINATRLQMVKCWSSLNLLIYYSNTGEKSDIFHSRYTLCSYFIPQCGPLQKLNEWYVPGVQKFNALCPWWHLSLYRLIHWNIFKFSWRKQKCPEPWYFGMWHNLKFLCKNDTSQNLPYSWAHLVHIIFTSQVNIFYWRVYVVSGL